MELSGSRAVPCFQDKSEAAQGSELSQGAPQTGKKNTENWGLNKKPSPGAGTKLQRLRAQAEAGHSRAVNVLLIKEKAAESSTCQSPASHSSAAAQLVQEGSSEADEQFMQSGIRGRVAGTWVNTSIFVQVPSWLGSGAVPVKSALVGA